MSGSDWPDIPPDITNDLRDQAKLERYKAELDLTKALILADAEAADAETQRDLERELADYASYYATRSDIHRAYIDVAAKSVERSVHRAEFVQRVAAAIATAYTAILALSFSVEKQAPLSASGLVPLLFLSAAFVLATAYVSYVTSPGNIAVVQDGGTLASSLKSQRNAFILWTRSSVLRRVFLLRAAVISLGVGVCFMPLPYIEVPNPWLAVSVALGAGAVVLLPTITHVLDARMSRSESQNELNMPRQR